MQMKGWIKLIVAWEHFLMHCSSTKKIHFDKCIFRKRKDLASSFFGRNKSYIDAFNQLRRFICLWANNRRIRAVYKFTCKRYGKNSYRTPSSINNIRYNIYSTERKLRADMPKCVKIAHQRVNYQTSIWRKYLEQFVSIGNPVNHG